MSFKHVRMATVEEIERLRATSDYSRESAVFAFDQNEGDSDYAVVKRVYAMDPVYFGKHTNDVQKAKFVFALEERMAGAGIDQYYFNVKADDSRWQRVIETWGAERVSPTTEVQYKKVLFKLEDK